VALQRRQVAQVLGEVLQPEARICRRQKADDIYALGLKYAMALLGGLM
jgi:hypothetical protein